MWFTSLSVGSLDLQAHHICCMSVQDVMDYHNVNDYEPMRTSIKPERDSNMESYSSEEEQEVEDNGEFD